LESFHGIYIIIASYILELTPSETKYKTLNNKIVTINGSIISTGKGR